MNESFEYLDPRRRLENAVMAEVIKVNFTELLDVELLELLLGSFTAPETGHALARQCQRQFGSLKNVLAASTDALERAGLSSPMILSIKIIGALSERLNLQIAETLTFDRSQISAN